MAEKTIGQGTVTNTEQSTMRVQIAIDDRLITRTDLPDIEQDIKEGLVIRRYVNGDLSIGEVKEILGFQYIDETLNWLNQKGIATTRKLPDELAGIERKNYLNLKKRLS